MFMSAKADFKRMALRRLTSRLYSEYIAPFLKVFRSEDENRLLQFEDCFIISRGYLRLVGFSSYESAFTGKKTPLNPRDWKIAICSVIPGIFMYSCFLWNFFHELRNNILIACEILLFLISFGLIFIEGILFYFWRKQIQNVIRESRSLWLKLCSGKNDDGVRKLRSYSFWNKLYVYNALFATLLHIVHPLGVISSNYLTNQNVSFLDVRILPITYPFAIDTLWKYVLCFGFEAGLLVMGTTCWASVDTAIFNAILSSSVGFLRVATKFRHVTDGLDKRDDELLLKRLAEIGRAHSDMLTNTNRVRWIFSPIILAVMLHGSLAMGLSIICMKLLLFGHDYFGVVRSFLHFLSLFFQSMGYCLACDDLNGQAESISTAIYECDWTDRSIKFRKLMVSVMMMAQKGYHFTTYGVYNIDKQKATKIVLATYNLVTLLKQIDIIEQ